MVKYLLGFGLAFAITALLTPIVRRFALSHGILDRPAVEARKQHGRPVAYLGGVAIFGGFLVAASLLLPSTRQLTALIAGCALLALVGIVDDVKGLSPWIKLGWQILAAVIALSGGIGISIVTNPFGGTIDLTYGRFAVELFGRHFHIAPIANLMSIVWMVGLANTVNFLDGLDGLAAGVSGISGLILFLLAVGSHIHQPAVALLAIILAGAAFGFLPQNFYPAKIFMGDSGAYFLGLVLAMLAIYSGAKLATAALVLGLPLVDAIIVALRRMRHGRSPFRADRQHFHYLLIAAGLSQRQVVLIYYAVALIFGLSAVFGNTLIKLIAFGVLIVLTVACLIVLDRRQRRVAG